MNYTFLLWVAIILLSTKLFGLLVRKISLPDVVGYLIAGIVIGPSFLNLMSISGKNGTFLQFTAEFGVIFLMFEAGLTTDIAEMKKNAVASFCVAVLGVIVPLVGGTILYIVYFQNIPSDFSEMIDSLFIGVVLTATSVSITVQTLKELGCLNSKVGTTILGAAVIDDILGIIVLTVVTGMRSKSDGLQPLFIHIGLYVGLIIILFYLTQKAEPVLKRMTGLQRSALFSFAFAFLLSYISEEYFGITDITGAYFAGLMLSRSAIAPYIDRRIGNVINMFFGAIFFACIGIKVTLTGMHSNLWIFAVLLVVVAILSKVVGCGIGALMNRFTLKESLQIGIGMISRGEVALIVAEKGHQLGILSEDMFSPVILVVIVTTLVAPVLLKIAFSQDYHSRLS